MQMGKIENLASLKMAELLSGEDNLMVMDLNDPNWEIQYDLFEESSEFFTPQFINFTIDLENKIKSKLWNLSTFSLSQNSKAVPIKPDRIILNLSFDPQLCLYLKLL